MLFPSIFRENLYDDFFGAPMIPAGTAAHAMKTDVRETAEGYELLLDLPGIRKENICAELKDGCLTVSASAEQNRDEKDGSGRLIRRERYTGSYSRCFYVGDAVTESDIKASFTDGVLKLHIPKKEPVPKESERRIIPIEG